MSETQTQQQPEQQAPAFTLLGTIGYNSPADLENFVNNLNLEGGIFVLIQAANYAQSKGVFNLSEAALIASSIKKFLKPPPSPAEAGSDQTEG
jgi:hypothetical protein